jgi:RNA polymerase sigma factor (TIGR02999 family)
MVKYPDSDHPSQRTAFLRRCASIEQLGNIGMIHERDGLSLGFEAGENGSRITPLNANQFNGEATLDGLGLIGHPHRAHPPFPDRLQEFVFTGNDGSRRFELGMERRSDRTAVAIIGGMSDVTRILSRIDSGDPSEADKLLPLVYEELRKLAAARLAQEKPGQTLQATALVHDAFVRLVDAKNQQSWNSRGHFFAAAAEAMRRILVENARRRQRQRHGGGWLRQELGDPAAPDTDDRLLALDEALTRLAQEDPLAARVVALRRFADLGHEDIAAALNITVYQARQKWTYARAWLRAELNGET